MDNPPVEVIGRQAELALVQERLADGSVVIAGPPGIGKTTLWRAAIARIAPGATLLEATAAAAEEGFGYALLADLVGDLSREGLSDPKRHALERVLLNLLTSRANAGRYVQAELEALIREQGDATGLFSTGGLLKALVG